MAERSVIFTLIGKDLASKAFDSAGNAAERLGKKVSGVDKGMGSALKGLGAVAGVAATAAAALGGIGAAAVAVGDEATNLSLAVGKARLFFG